MAVAGPVLTGPATPEESLPRPVPLVCPACRGPLARDGSGARCARCRASYPERDGILLLVTGRRGAPGYDPHYFSTLPDVEDAHFWYVERRAVILDALRATVPDLSSRPLFDVGCGSGGLLAFLARSGVTVAGACDAYPQGLALARRRLGVPLVLVDEDGAPPLGPGHALLGLFDVLEHLDDDAGALRFLWSALEPGGVLVLTVPAHPFLFDEMDELARHRRRYTRRELRGRLEGAGFRVRRLTHFMAPLVPLLAMVRAAGRRLPGRGRPARERRDAELRVVPFVNGLLRLVLSLERLWLRVLPLPFGSSIVAVADRPREGP